MRTIYKYEFFGVHNRERFEFDFDARILKVGCQRGKVVMWVELDPLKDVLSHRYFTIFGTGQALTPANNTYIGTVIMSDSLAWHIYEEVANDKE